MEMAASPIERSWCVLEFVRCNGFVAIQRVPTAMKLQSFLFQIAVTSCFSVQRV
jgi:hypothetical protein